jgi:hypothetical protein
MPSFLYVGSEPRDMAAEAGVTAFEQSFTVEPGETVDADVNPDPRFFDPVVAEPAPPEGA